MGSLLFPDSVKVRSFDLCFDAQTISLAGDGPGKRATGGYPIIAGAYLAHVETQYRQLSFDTIAVSLALGKCQWCRPTSEEERDQYREARPRLGFTCGGKQERNSPDERRRRCRRRRCPREPGSDAAAAAKAVSSPGSGWLPYWDARWERRDDVLHSGLRAIRGGRIGTHAGTTVIWVQVGVRRCPFAVRGSARPDACLGG